MNEVNIEPNCESFIFNITIADLRGWQRDEDTISMELWWSYPCVNYDSKEEQDAREFAQAEMLKIKNLPKQIINGIYNKKINENYITYNFELPYADLRGWQRDEDTFTGLLHVGNNFSKNIELIIKKYSNILDRRNISKGLKRKECISMY